MKQAPTFGAIPSAADRKQKHEQEAQEAEKREDVVERCLQPDARARLNKLEMEEPEKVDQLKEQIFSMARRGEAKTASVSDADVTRMLKGMAEAAESRGIALPRRRFDDSDSDVDLDGL